MSTRKPYGSDTSVYVELMDEIRQKLPLELAELASKKFLDGEHDT